MRVLVTHDNRETVAKVLGGQLWSDGVIVVQPDGMELHVRVGEVLAQRWDGMFLILVR